MSGSGGIEKGGLRKTYAGRHAKCCRIYCRAGRQLGMAAGRQRGMAAGRRAVRHPIRSLGLGLLLQLQLLLLGQVGCSMGPRQGKASSSAAVSQANDPCRDVAAAVRQPLAMAALWPGTSRRACQPLMPMQTTMKALRTQPPQNFRSAQPLTPAVDDQPVLALRLHQPVVVRPDAVNVHLRHVAPG